MLPVSSFGEESLADAAGGGRVATFRFGCPAPPSWRQIGRSERAEYARFWAPLPVLLSGYTQSARIHCFAQRDNFAHEALVPRIVG